MSTSTQRIIEVTWLRILKIWALYTLGTMILGSFISPMLGSLIKEGARRGGFTPDKDMSLILDFVAGGLGSSLAGPYVLRLLFTKRFRDFKMELISPS